jgi:DNA-binding IclR family transcriptional regulator
MFHYSESSRVTVNSASPVKTVDRLVRILDCFSRERPAWSLAELSAYLGLPKSTLHRFLVSLESHGVLRREAADRQWRLGYRLSIWGNAAAQSTGLRHVARPVMRDLVAATGETAILTVYHAHEVICIEKVETSHSVRMTLDVGMRRPPHAGASSKVLMAYLPEEEIQAIVQDKGLPQLCCNTGGRHADSQPERGYDSGDWRRWAQFAVHRGASRAVRGALPPGRPPDLGPARPSPSPQPSPWQGEGVNDCP